MNPTPNEDVAEALGALLEDEREALVKGDLEKLSDLLTPKEELIEALSGAERPDPSVVKMLDKKVRRNQLLLDGAMEGIRAVTSRLAEIQAVKGPLETYGADGRKKDVVVEPESSVERRA